MISFTVNGEIYYTKQNLVLFDLLNYFDYNQELLVLEYNNLVCSKKNWRNIFIKINDKIEIVTIV